MVDDVDVAHVQIQRLKHRLVALHQLGGGKAGRVAGGLGVVLNDVCDRVDGAVDSALAEVHFLGGLFVVDGLDDDVQQVGDAFPFGGGDRDDRDTQPLRELFDVDAVAAGAHLVHHIQRQDHRDVQLHQLQGQVEVALQVGGVDDVDDGVGMFLD